MSPDADIEVVLTERILRHALSAYAAEHFTHRVFPYPDIGVTLLGEHLTLTLSDTGVAIGLQMQAVLEWGIKDTITLPPRHETFGLRLSATFDVAHGGLFIRLAEGHVHLDGARADGEGGQRGRGPAAPSGLCPLPPPAAGSV